MFSVRKFTQMAVAVMAVAGAASVQAATFAAPVDLDFTLSDTILGFLGNSPVINTAGGATVSGNTITLPASSVTLGNANASDLVAATLGSFSITTTSAAGTVTTLDLSGLSFSNITKQLTATIKINGNVAYSGASLTTSSTQTLEAFNATAGTGLLQSANFFLTDSAATGLLTAMGINPFQQAFIKPTLLATSFGTLTVDTVSAVPEPSSYALMGVGLVGVALVARRKSRRAA